MFKEDVRKMRKDYFIFMLVLVVAILMAIFALRICGDSVPNEIESCSVEKETASVPSSESMYALAASVNDLSASIDQLREELIGQAEADNVEEQTKAELQSIEARCWDYVRDITANYYPDVDPDYAYAIIYRESRFRPDAVNENTGVVGLMQINPKWHTKRANDLGVTDLKDPYGNIMVGCDILHEVSQGENFEYALNFFAGGYPYADRYRNKTSPYVKELNQIIESDEFSVFKGGV